MPAPARWRTTRSRRLTTLAAVPLVLAAAGCGAVTGKTAAATVTKTITVTQTATPTPSETPTPTDSASASASAGATDSLTPDPSATAGSSSGPASTGGTPTPGSVSTTRAGQPLGLSDAQAANGTWEENRYEVADQSGVRGMGVPVNRCGSSPGNDIGLEYRLANRFTKLNMIVAQANSSPQSDQGLTVEVVANGAQLDIETVPFNQLKPISLTISGVNALQIRLYLDEKNKACNPRGVIAVVEQLVVS